MNKLLRTHLACIGFFSFFLGHSAFADRLPGQDKPLEPFVWEGNADIKTGASPDNSHELFLSAINSAKRSLYLEAYMLRSGDISEAIEEAAKRGVRVEILLDGWTVGKPKAEKIDPIELYYAQKIVAAGGKITYMKSDDARRADRRFVYIHAKFAVMDELNVFISSENFANSGFSPTANRGNRGWVIAIKSKAVAKAYLEIFKKDSSVDPQFDDLALYGSTPEYTLNDRNFVPNNPAQPGTYRPEPGKTIRDRMVIERITSPDDSLATDRSIIGAIDSAELSVDVEALSFTPHFGNNAETPESSPNPVAESVLNAARRGLKVRLLLNPPIFGKKPDQPNDPEKPEPPKEIIGMIAESFSDFNLFSLPSAINQIPGNGDSKPAKENTRDNKFLIEYFREIAKKENLDLDAHFFYVSDDKLKALHNKGMIVDGCKTLISSINWVENSFKNNREVAVMVHNSRVADYYSKLFEIDWKYFRNFK